MALVLCAVAIVPFEDLGRIGQVDHELGGVLQLDEELFDGLGFVIHAAALQMLT